MRRSIPQSVLLVAWSSLTATGCQSVGSRFLSLIGIQEKPLVLTLVADGQVGKESGPLALLNPFGPYDRLRAALHEELGRPVPVTLCFPFQLAPGLSHGMYHLAIVSPLQYARLPHRGRFAVLAVPADESGRVARPALLVVAADSAIQSVEDLRGKTVAFGPSGDSRTHHAALELLARHGLHKTDLSLELLPLPGSLKHMPTPRAVAQTVVHASSHAGFIDQAAWEALPEHAERAEDPARDQLRVIARTVALPDRLVLSSPKLDAELTESLRAVLLTADREHPAALRPLRISSYQPPTEELLAACGRLVEQQAAEEVPDE